MDREGRLGGRAKDENRGSTGDEKTGEGVREGHWNMRDRERERERERDGLRKSA